MSTETRDDSLAPTFTPNGALSETLAQGEEEPGSSTLGALPPALAELPEASFEPELAEPESKRSDARGAGLVVANIASVSGFIARSHPRPTVILQAYLVLTRSV